MRVSPAPGTHSAASCQGDRRIGGAQPHAPHRLCAVSEPGAWGWVERSPGGLSRGLAGCLRTIWESGSYRHKAFLLSLPGKRAHHPGGSAVKNPPTMQETWVQSWSQEDPLDPGGRILPGGRQSYPLQYSCLEDPMDRGACWATVHGAVEQDTT